MRQDMMMDIGFSIQTKKEFEELTQVEIITALLGRITDLMHSWDKDAIGFCDSFDDPESLCPIKESLRWPDRNHPIYTRKSWKAEILRGDTEEGYWQWVVNYISD